MTDSPNMTTARDAILWNCRIFLEDYLNEQSNGSNAEWLKEYFSNYDYTVEKYIDELKNAAMVGLRAGLLRVQKMVELAVPRDKKLEKEWSERLIWRMKTKMNAVKNKWFSVEREPQGTIECALLDRGIPSGFFNNLSLRAFELYRTAKGTPFAKYIKGDLPILFFGNLKEYLYSEIRILTLSKAPSSNEFTDGIERFQESEIDFTTLFHPMDKPWEINQYLGVCSGYFKRNPNWNYFQRFNPLLQDLLASYLCEKNRYAIKQHINKCRQEKLLSLEMLRNIVVHFNYSTPLVLDKPWDALTESEKEIFSLEDAFPDILKALSPDIIICDFDIKGTCLADGARKTTIPSDWELSESHGKIPAYLRGDSQYILIIPYE